jgi:hypothetical protein
MGAKKKAKTPKYLLKEAKTPSSQFQISEI